MIIPSKQSLFSFYTPTSKRDDAFPFRLLAPSKSNNCLLHRTFDASFLTSLTVPTTIRTTFRPPTSSARTLPSPSVFYLIAHSLFKLASTRAYTDTLADAVTFSQYGEPYALRFDAVHWGMKMEARHVLHGLGDLADYIHLTQVCRELDFTVEWWDGRKWEGIVSGRLRGR